MSARTILWLVCAATVLLSAAYAGFFAAVRTEYAYVDRNTGSTYGYHEWITGQRTDAWSQVSPLEAYVQAHWPGTVTHRWVSCAGTGKSLFGRSVSFGHGASTGAFLLREGAIELWIKSHTPEEVRGLYRELSSASFGDSFKIADRVMDEASTGYRQRLSSGQVKPPP